MRSKPTIQEIRSFSNKVKTSKDFSYLKDCLGLILLYLEHSIEEDSVNKKTKKEIEDKLNKLDKKMDSIAENSDKNFKNLEKTIKSLKSEVEDVRKLLKIVR